MKAKHSESINEGKATCKDRKDKERNQSGRRKVEN